jgi:hypothetical protein
MMGLTISGIPVEMAAEEEVSMSLTCVNCRAAVGSAFGFLYRLPKLNGQLVVPVLGETDPPKAALCQLCWKLVPEVEHSGDPKDLIANRALVHLIAYAPAGWRVGQDGDGQAMAIDIGRLIFIKPSIAKHFFPLVLDALRGQR